MKILILIIRYDKQNLTRVDYNYLMPAGIAYISSVLKNDGYDVKCLNLNHHEGTVDDLIRKALQAEKYDFVLTGGLSFDYLAIKNCLDSVRRHSSAQIITGNALVSAQPELMFKELKPDYMVIGEGELTILELLRCLQNMGDLSKVDGIGYRDQQDKLVLTKEREPIGDIDSLPWPDYEGLGFDTYLNHLKPSYSFFWDVFDYPRPYPLIASRSCPFSCTFCYHAIRKYRQRSVSNVIEELKFALTRYKINLIDILDDLFSYDKERFNEFCQQLKLLRSTVPWELKWSCQMRVDKVDEDVLLKVKDAGCYMIGLGLESYSLDVLKSMEKHITPQQIDRTLQLARRLNISVQGNFIFGDAAETTKTANETLNYWKNNLCGLGISLGFIIPFPGTALYRHCIKKGIVKDEIDFVKNHLDGKPINMSNTMTDKEFKKLQMDIFEAYSVHDHHECVVPKKWSRNEIQVRCPHCNVIVTYKNYDPGSKSTIWFKKICCRNCRLRFSIITPFYKARLMLIRLIGVKNANYVRVLLLNLLIRAKKFRLKYPIFAKLKI